MTTVTLSPSLSPQAFVPLQRRLYDALYDVAVAYGSSGDYSLIEKSGHYEMQFNGRTIYELTPEREAQTQHSVSELVARMTQSFQRSVSPTLEDAVRRTVREAQTLQQVHRVNRQASSRSLSGSQELPRNDAANWVTQASILSSVVLIIRELANAIFDQNIPLVKYLSHLSNAFKLGSEALFYQKACHDEDYARQIKDQDAATQATLVQTSAKVTFLQGALGTVSTIFERLNKASVVSFLGRALTVLGLYKSVASLGRAIYRIHKSRELFTDVFQMFRDASVDEKTRFSETLIYFKTQMQDPQQLSRLQRYTSSEFVSLLHSDLNQAIISLEEGRSGRAVEIMDEFCNAIGKQYLQEQINLVLSTLGFVAATLTIAATSFISSMVPNLIFLAISTVSLAILTNQLERLMPVDAKKRVLPQKA